VSEQDYLSNSRPVATDFNQLTRADTTLKPLMMVNDVYLATNRGSGTMLLQLDLSLAFDTLDISTMLRCLRFTLTLLVQPLNGSGCTSHIISSRSDLVKSNHLSVTANTVSPGDPFLDQCCFLCTLYHSPR